MGVSDEARRAVGHLLVHVGHVEARHLADLLEERHRALGVVGVHVHAQRAVVADDQHGVAQVLEQRREGPGVEALAGDGEVGAVAEARGLVLGAVERGGRVLVVELRRGVGAQPGQAAGEDHGEPVGAGVHHAGLAQDRELLRPALHGLLARLEGVLEHLGEQLVLLLDGGVGTEAPGVHVREVVRHAAGHRTDRREHRALGRVADRRVGGVGGARERGGDEDRIDQLARPRSQLLGRPADDLGEDHAGVAARAEQRRARDRADDLVAAGHVDGPAVHAVELVEHRPEGERHVVARVAVGDREDVQVVDLLAAVLELREGGGDDPPEAQQALVRHRRVLHQTAAGLLREPA